MKIAISNNLALTDIQTPDLANSIREKLTLKNPAYDEAEKMGRWTGNIPKALAFWKESGDGLTVPRGLFSNIKLICSDIREPVTIEDNRRTLPPVDYSFTGYLREYQQEAVEEIIARDEATLSAPTGAGKTVIGLAIIAERRQPALIIVHTRELMEQWKERIETFLGIPAADIGQIGGGKKTIGEKITVSIVNTLYQIAPDIKKHFGHIVIDECHRAPSRTFTEALAVFDARFRLGLSATPFRRDGLSSVIFWHCGPLCKINPAEVKATGAIVPATVTIKQTGFIPLTDPAEEYSRSLAELTEDQNRTAAIARDVAAEAKNGGGTCLCLTDRKKHAEAISCALERHHQSAEILTGDMTAGKRQEIVDRLNSGNVKVLIATGQLIGEGFDCKGLSNLFLASPVSFHGRLIQYLGRVLRPAPGKTAAKIFDYIDAHAVFRAAAQKRKQIYLKNDWRIYEN
ncbi:MAG TPA: DEAD/DEAH box helicase family protein [Smithellaceae bacterium]|nr:DEAD/DEAH box helicase family protein [Smithellaceae bacterium]